MPESIGSDDGRLLGRNMYLFRLLTAPFGVFLFKHQFLMAELRDGKAADSSRPSSDRNLN